MVIIVAAVTVAAHHLVMWYVLPSSVFNYDAPLWVVGVHAMFVVLEAVAACFIARGFFDNVVELEQHVQERTHLLSEANAELNEEMRSALALKKNSPRVHREFLEAARRAGMAEVATGVLHNVGNALNSVTVSVSMMASQLKKSRVPQLGSTVALFDKHSVDLGNYLTTR